MRAWGASFGLYHADEPIVVNHALAYASGDLNPHFYKLPPLTSYVLFGTYGVFFLAGKLLGFFKSVGEFEKLFFQKPLVFYEVGRLFLGAFLGTATVVTLYRHVRRYFNERAALFSALFLAFNFLHGRDSHFIYADIPMTFFMMGCVFLSLRLLNETGWSAYWPAGVFLGIACAFKYNAAIAAVPIITAHCLSERKPFHLLLMTGLLSLGVYIILNPFSVKDFAFFMKEFSGQGSVEGSAGVLYHLRYSLVQGCGILLLLAGACGWMIAWKSYSRQTTVILSFVTAFYAALIFFSQTHERYALPLIPFICFGAGVLADRWFTWRGGVLKTAAAALLVIAWLIPAAKLVQTDLLFARPDTRDLARIWIEKNVPSEKKVAFSHSFQRPRLGRSMQQWDQLKAEGSLRVERIVKEKKYARTDGPLYTLYFLSDRPTTEFTQAQPTLAFDMKKIQEERIDYAVVHYEEADTHQAFYANLKSSAKLVERISPYADPKKSFSVDSNSVTAAAVSWSELFSRKNFGPVLEIYRVGNSQ